MIEKLNSLLVEYQEQFLGYTLIYWNKDYGCFMWDCLDSFYDFSAGVISFIISKDFGFIKWLLDNDRIDKKFPGLIDFMVEIGDYYNFEKCLIMILSIQDNPLIFLSSMLK